jgi:hypothetical protein
MKLAITAIGVLLLCCGIHCSDATAACNLKVSEMGSLTRGPLGVWCFFEVELGIDKQ